MIEERSIPRIAFRNYYATTLQYNLLNSGKPYDSAAAKSFFASLNKEELYHRKDYASEPDFRRSISAYMEFYNMKRPYRTLKNRTPCQMEEDYQEVMGQSHGK